MFRETVLIENTPQSVTFWGLFEAQFRLNYCLGDNPAYLARLYIFLQMMIEKASKHIMSLNGRLHGCCGFEIVFSRHQLHLPAGTIIVYSKQLVFLIQELSGLRDIDKGLLNKFTIIEIAFFTFFVLNLHLLLLYHSNLASNSPLSFFR